MSGMGLTTTFIPPLPDMSQEMILLEQEIKALNNEIRKSYSPIKTEQIETKKETKDPPVISTKTEIEKIIE